MKNKFIARHGDVLLKKIDRLPEEIKVLKDKTLAYGEVTGHSHRFENPENIERYTFGDRKFLQVFNADTLIHEEHGPQVILPGIYEQIQEREYDYIEESSRAAID